MKRYPAKTTIYGLTYLSPASFAPRTIRELNVDSPAANSQHICLRGVFKSGSLKRPFIKFKSQSKINDNCVVLRGSYVECY